MGGRKRKWGSVQPNEMNDDSCIGFHGLCDVA